MAPQNLNIELLLTTPELLRSNSKEVSYIYEQDKIANVDITTAVCNKECSITNDQGRKKRFIPLKPILIDPIHMIKTILIPGISSASCNEETLSSSFLILDGLSTISLGKLSSNANDELSDSVLEEAIERWGARYETNISVGKVCYEYSCESEEDEEEKCLSFSSSDGEDTFHPGGSILSQKLDLIPLVLENSFTHDTRAPNPELYLPPSHRMVADCLKFGEYTDATNVYLDILKADRERYGESDLVCAVDYHNLGVTYLLSGDLDTSLSYFQESVLLKRSCQQKNDITVADTLVEIGIILYIKGNTKAALSIFNEAMDVYVRNNEESPCSVNIGRVHNNIGCVYYKMGDLNSALLHMQKSLTIQRNALGMNSKAESALISCAMTQANVGYLKYKCDDHDALATLEESILVLESVLGENIKTVIDVGQNISFAKEFSKQ